MRHVVAEDFFIMNISHSMKVARERYRVGSGLTEQKSPCSKGLCYKEISIISQVFYTGYTKQFFRPSPG
jgi:hypothetical protein